MLGFRSKCPFGHERVHVFAEDTLNDLPARALCGVVVREAPLEELEREDIACSVCLALLRRREAVFVSSSQFTSLK